MKERIGVIDVGGGWRGIYAAGVLDYCMDHGIQFDAAIGVSAGSANLISYAAGQRGRNYRFFTEYGLRHEYAGIRNFIRKGSYVDLDYVYSTLSNSDGENPLDYPAAAANPMEFWVVATEAETGKPRYFHKGDIAQDNYDVMKASSAIPFVCQPYFIQGTPYYDGALSDPIPLELILARGCQRVVVLLTLPKDTVRTPRNDPKAAARIRRRYPLAAEALEQRTALYNRKMEMVRQLEAQGKALIVAPEDTCGVRTLSRDPEALRRLYAEGYRNGAAIPAFLHK